MKRFLLSFLLLGAILLASYHIVCTWRGLSLLQGDLSKDKIFRAIQLSPSNPDPFYKLGLFYQRDIQDGDLKESLRYLRRAIEKNRLEQDYWLNLANVLLRLSSPEASELALEKAILTSPTGYRGRWIAANLLLQQGLEKALPHFSYILANYPDESGLVYDVLHRATHDSGLIFDRVVPKEPSSVNRYLAYLYEAGDKESAKRVWNRRISYGLASDREGRLPHIEFLIAQGEIDEAFQIWKAGLREEGIPVSGDDSNLITNGGFETEKTLGGGFDWRISSVEGAEVSFDPLTALEGARSLRIVFNGKENVDFYHVSQYVASKPKTEYVLKGYMKTQGLTTTNGIRMEVVGVGPAFHQASASLVGDNKWKEVRVTFRTPAESQGLLVRIRREKTDKFDRLLSGTVWIDDVSLTETKGH